MHSFSNFLEQRFCRKHFNNCLWFKWYNDLCHVTLCASRNCWKTLWIDSSIAFINDIPLKRIKRQYNRLIFNTFSLCAGKLLSKTCTCTLRKSIRIRSFSGPYFPAFGLNTERYGVFLRIQSKWEKIRARKTPNTDTFDAVAVCESTWYSPWYICTKSIPLRSWNLLWSFDVLIIVSVIFAAHLVLP